MKIDHEIISTVILVLARGVHHSFKKGCCQFQAKVFAQSTFYPLSQACPGKSVVRSTDRLDMTIALTETLGIKQNKTIASLLLLNVINNMADLAYMYLTPILRSHVDVTGVKFRHCYGNQRRNISDYAQTVPNPDISLFH